MRTTLNTEQAKGLANFFFDLAKGVILSGIGSVIVSPEMKIVTILSTMLLVLACVRIALFLLEEAK